MNNRYLMKLGFNKNVERKLSEIRDEDEEENDEEGESIEGSSSFQKKVLR